MKLWSGLVRDGGLKGLLEGRRVRGPTPEAQALGPSAGNGDAAPDGRRVQASELEFLPAALEIQESPPSPVGRIMLFSIIGLFAAGILWSIVGTTDIIVVARGKIIPAEHSKTVQPLESGIIRSIHVRDGQHVRQGEVLIELDPTASEAEHKRIMNEHHAALVEIARLRAVITGRPALQPPDGADPKLLTLQTALLQDQRTEQQERLDAARLLIAQRQAGVEATRASIQRLEAMISLGSRRRQEYLTALVQAARFRALVAGRQTFDTPREADPQIVAAQRQLLGEQWEEYQGRLRAVSALVEQRKAAVEAVRAAVAQLEATLPIIQQQAEAHRALYEQGVVSRLQYLEIERKRIETAQELASQRHKLSEALAARAEAERQLRLVSSEFKRARMVELAEVEARIPTLLVDLNERSVDRTQELAVERQRLVRDLAALAEVEKQYRTIETEFRKNRLAELTAAETRAGSLRQEVVKASQRAAIQRLVAPIDGVVQQLSVHTVGGVVTPAQPLMVIVPVGQRLEAEAWVENKDIGLVNVGHASEVKVDAFPFTRYGTIPAVVTVLSEDAVQLENGALVYAARVTLERSALQVEGKFVDLSPGMAVTVDMKTGRRRLIEFFLSPLLRYQRESIRER